MNIAQQMTEPTFGDSFGMIMILLVGIIFISYVTVALCELVKDVCQIVANYVRSRNSDEEGDTP